MNTKSTDTNKLPAEVLSRMYIGWRDADGYRQPIDAMQAAYDASPGPALEAEKVRLREENQQLRAMYDEAVNRLGNVAGFLWPGPFTMPDGSVVDGSDAAKVRAHDAARTASARAKGE